MLEPQPEKPRQVIQQLLQRVIPKATAACEGHLHHLPRAVGRQRLPKVAGVVPLRSGTKPGSDGKMRCQGLVPQPSWEQ